MGNKGLGTVADQEVTIAEAPENTDTGKVGIAGCLKVNITIADIDSIHFPPALSYSWDHSAKQYLELYKSLFVPKSPPVETAEEPNPVVVDIE